MSGPDRSVEPGFARELERLRVGLLRLGGEALLQAVVAEHDELADALVGLHRRAR